MNTKEDNLKLLPTVSIGIPAYNEAFNILKLAKTLCAQKEKGFVLSEIIIISDGSTDQTINKLKELIDPRFLLFYGKKRLGKPARINEIFKIAKSDILVLLDADIIIKSDELISNLIEPLIKNSNVSVSFGSAKPLNSINIAQEIIREGWDMWDELRYEVQNAELYRCEGTIRAFKRSLYLVMRFPNVSADDVFPFLYCKKNNINVKFVSSAVVFYSLPTSLSDYISQTARFMNSKSIHIAVFDKKFVNQFYVIKTKHKIHKIATHFKKNPIKIIAYLFVYLIPKLQNLALKKSYAHPLWTIALSTKKMTKRKIIFSNYDDVHNPVYGGGGAYSIHETARRVSLHYDVSVITGNYAGATNKIIDGVSYERIGTQSLGARFGQLIYQLILPFYVFCKTYDVWIESFTPPFSVSLSPLISRKPHIGLVHMLAGKDMDRKYHLPFSSVENLGLKWYKHFIVLTIDSEKQIRMHNKNASINVITNGVHVTPAVLPNEKIKKYLLFIGRLEVDQKGLDLLIKSYAIAKDKLGIPLIIAGSGSEKNLSTLKTLIKDLGVTNDVKLIGRVGGPSKHKLISEAYIGVVTSRLETFSITVLDFMSHGIPIVMFDISGMRWVPENAALKIKPFSCDRFSKALINIAENKNLRSQISINSRNTANLYDWDAVGEQYHNLIENILINNNG